LPPQVRAVCLMDVHTHLIRAAAFGAYTTGELSYARDLMASVSDDSLTTLIAPTTRQAFCWRGSRKASNGTG
jgi:hypothetical protein